MYLSMVRSGATMMHDDTGIWNDGTYNIGRQDVGGKSEKYSRVRMRAGMS